MEGAGREAGQVSSRLPLRWLLTAALVAAILFEAYYIMVLRETIKKQTEDLRSISVQIQLMKSEREGLNEELSSARKHAGEKDDGNAAQR